MKAYCGVIADVTVDPRTGRVVVRRGWIAADVGEVIDLNGLTNQVEGGFVQAASWPLQEQVDAGRPADWEAYPILRFSETPELTTRLLDHPDRRVLGAGEASTGPTAIANAVFQATGARLRALRPSTVLLSPPRPPSSNLLFFEALLFESTPLEAVIQRTPPNYHHAASKRLTVSFVVSPTRPGRV